MNKREAIEGLVTLALMGLGLIAILYLGGCQLPYPGGHGTSKYKSADWYTLQKSYE